MLWLLFRFSKPRALAASSALKSSAADCCIGNVNMNAETQKERAYVIARETPWHTYNIS